MLVIPGKVVGIDIEDAKIGRHWRKLQSVFGQSDQCLDIDDPLTAILDRVHSNTSDKSEIDRYAITRLASVGLERSVNKSLSAYRARKSEQGKWVEDRIAAAIEYQAKERPESEEDLVEHQVASTLGISLPVVERLSKALESADDNHTVADWRRWFFSWIGDNGEPLAHDCQQAARTHAQIPVRVRPFTGVPLTGVSCARCAPQTMGIRE